MKVYYQHENHETFFKLFFLFDFSETHYYFLRRKVNVKSGTIKQDTWPKRQHFNKQFGKV